MATITKLQKAKGKLLINQVFFATLVMATPLIADATLPTAATDMLKIYYNAAFIDGLSIDHIMFVLAHEVMHIVFKHGLRRGNRNPQLWNIACDYAINLILHEAGFVLLDGVLYDPKYKGMGAEQIYDLLKQEQEKNGGKPGDHEDKSGMGEDVREPSNMSAEDKAKAEQQVQQRVAQAANMARMAGKLPAGLQRLVDEILNPAVPWQDLLRDYMTRITQDDESWARRNRRFNNVYLPARRTERMGTIVFIADTSGSISQKEINQVASEMRVVSETLRPESIRVVCCDADIAGDVVFDEGDEINFEPKGGGGTDMRVALDYVEQYDPVVVVLCTDGWTPWPTTEPPYPLIVCCTTNADVPIGEVVRV